jgi:single-stranded DNA-specific DHH superfamily exonuclease
MSNAKPRFIAHDLTVLEDRKIGKDGRHRKLVVEQNGVTRDVIWFNGNSPHPLRTMKSMIYYLDINVWHDRETVQLNAQYVEA